MSTRHEPLDTRTPEEKAAGVAAKLAWLDALPPEWQGVFDEMKARREEARKKGSVSDDNDNRFHIDLGGIIVLLTALAAFFYAIVWIWRHA